MLIAMVASVALVRKLRATARQTDSPALAADALHYASDVFTNAAALLALVIVWLTGVRLADPIFSLGISCYILWSAISVARESIDTLMDRRLPAEIDEQVAEVISRYQDEGVHGFHDLRTRRSGAFKFIDLHLEIDGDQSLKASHELTVRVLHDLETQIPRSTVNIHTHPVEADLPGVD
jgi:ferrous-iron efflux pump FieF